MLGIKVGEVRWDRTTVAPRARLGMMNHFGSTGEKEPSEGFSSGMALPEF